MYRPRDRHVLDRAVSFALAGLHRTIKAIVSSDPIWPVPRFESLESRVLMARVEGIDVSQFQGTINWSQVAADDKEFAFIRASRSNLDLDPKFVDNISGATTAGLLAGPYHRALPKGEDDLGSLVDPLVDAQRFVNAAGAYMAEGYLRPVVDVEDGESLGKAALSAWVNNFVGEVERLTGVEPIIYCNTNFATNYLDSSVSARDLWIANWSTSYGDPLTDGSPPTGVWGQNGQTWDFWQYSSTGSVSGISGGVDLNAYHFDRESLDAWTVPSPETNRFQVSVNLGPYQTGVPSGYVNVAAQTYTNIFGYDMGWTSTGAVATTRPGGTAPDQRYRTYVSPNAGGVSRSFEVGVPNGTYRVRLVAGSPDQVGFTNKFSAEGTSVINGTTHTGTNFLSGVATVAVSDGRLTISSDTTAPNSKLSFIDIVDVSRIAVLPAVPSGVSSMANSSTAVDVRWIDHADNEGRDPSTFSSSTWGQVNEGYKIERRQLDGAVWSSWTARPYVRANGEFFQEGNLTAGKTYQYRVSAVNAAGASAATEGAPVTTPANNNQQTYSATGDPWPLGTVIQAEDFDRGGQNVAYLDDSTSNAGGMYRAGSVDLTRVGDLSTGLPVFPRQHRVSYTHQGEWLEYTVNVLTAGTYPMDFRVSTPGTGAKFHATTSQGGTETNLAAGSPGGTWDVPNTGDWDNFQTVSKTVQLPAGVQVIRVYIDQDVVNSNGGMDFDWLRITPVADLSVEGVDEAREATDGRYVRLNAGADEQNTDRLGNPLLDNEPDAAQGERIVGADADLRNATISIGVPGAWKLTFADTIRVWRESTPGNNSWIPVVSGEASDLISTAQQIALKIEGISPSKTVNDTDLQLTFTPTTGTIVSDTVKLTVSGVDLDIDSDNNGLYKLPSGSRTEESLEDDGTAPGKIVYVNDNDNDADAIVDNVDGYNRDQNSNTTADNSTAGERFVPITFTTRDPFDPSLATYQITYTGSDPRTDVGVGGPAGGLRLWSTSGDRPRNGFARLANGMGDYIAPGSYTGSQLGLSAANGAMTLWLEAAAMPSDPYQTITVTVDPDGVSGPASAELLDTVHVTVKASALEGAAISGFKWNDKNSDGIRNTVPLQGNPPELVYVIDVSGSTSAPLVGFENFDDLNNGDVNSDGKTYTRLDAELAGFIRLSQYFADPVRNYPTPPTVSIVLFGASAASVDMQSVPNVQLSVPLTSSSLAAIIQKLSSVRIGGLPNQSINVGQSTNYVAGLEEAHQLADSAALSPSAANVIFLSDGYPNPDNWTEYERSAESLRNAGFRVRAFGAGDEAQVGPLSLVDYYATGKIFHSRDELVSAFAGGAENYIEPPLQGWTIFADLNNDGVFDTNEQQYSAISDDEGNYTIIGLPAGTYTIREVLPAGASGWAPTAPAGGTTQVTVTAGQEIGGTNFGNHFSGSVDLDVDSDNTGDPPDRNQTEEDLENDPVNGAKQLTVSTGDIDVDGKLDFDDFDGIAGHQFARMVLDLSNIPDPSLASIAFAYSGSDPANATATNPASGYLRLWLKDADQARSATSDYIRPGQSYSASDLQVNPTTGLATLYVEAVGIPARDADRLIRTDVVTDTSTATRVMVSDSVYMQPEGHAPVFDAGTAPPTVLHVNPYGHNPKLPPAAIWKHGDVFASLYELGVVRQFKPDGTPFPDGQPYHDLPTGFTTGLAFDSNANLFITTFGGNSVLKYGPDGQPRPNVAGTFGTDESVVFDASGDMYVGNTGKNSQRLGILRFDPEGRFVDQYVKGEQVDFVDLAADQHTLLFTYEGFDGVVYSLDTNTGQYFRVLNSAPTNEAYALRILPDGDVLIATGEQIIRVRGDFTKPESPTNPTTVVQTYNAEYQGFGVGEWFAVNLDPDGKSFWSASLVTPALFKFDISTGELLQTIETGGGAAGISVYGERTAAIPVDQIYTYQFHATDEDLGDTVSYEFVGESHGATIDSVNGVTQWTPHDTGDFSFRIRAKDQRGTFDPANDYVFTVSVDHDVNGPNNAPEIPEQTLGPAMVGRTYTSKIFATDVDGDGLNYSLVDAPDMSIDRETGIVRWLPTSTETPRTFIVKVDDGRGGIAQRTFSINVLPSAQNNRVPSINPNLQDLSAISGQAFTFTVQSSDPDGDTVAYIATDIPRGMKLDRNSGQITWVPGFDQLGDQDFTIGVTDFKGGYDERTFTVSVNPGIVPITGIGVETAYLDAENKISDPTAKILAAQIDDPAYAFGATFTWTVVDKPSPSTPDPVIIPLSEAGDVIGVIFAEAGDYKFSVSATNSAGTGSFTQSNPFTIDAIATQIIAAPSSLTATTGQTVPALASTVYDQFGNAMTADVTWRFLSNGSQGTLTHNTDGSWSYTAGSNANMTDALQVSAASAGADPVTDVLPVRVTAQPELNGSASGNFSVTEGDSITYSGVHDTYGELGGFFDPLATSTTNPNTYSATIHWGDGSSSTGTVVHATGPDIPPQFAQYLFAVNGTHTFNQEGEYDFTIDITAPGGRTLTIASESGAGITVLSAKITAAPLPVTVQAWQQFTGVVATFDDPSPTSQASEFLVKIDWGDGETTDGTVVATSTAGHYEIQGTHTYSQVGAAAAVARIYESDDASTTPDNQPPLRAITPLKITGESLKLPTPTGVKAVAVSTSQIQITFDLDDRYVYLIKRLNPDGTTTTLPPMENGMQPGANTPYYDQNLPTNTRYGYQVLAADQWGNVSDASPIQYVFTWSLASAPQNVNAQALSGTLIRLTWTDGRASDPFISGWDILRAKGTGSTAPAQSEFVSLLNSGESLPSPTFDDDTVDPDTQYWYAVVAVKHLEERSQPSTPIPVTTLHFAGVPLAPTNLQAGYAGQASATSGGPGRIGLTWDAVQNASLLGYDVYRSTVPMFSLNASTLIGSSTDPFYVDDVTPGTTYYYAVRAVSVGKDGGEISSEPSNIASIDTSSPPATAPTAPTGLRATDVTIDHVTLAWNDQSRTEAEFDVYRRDQGASVWGTPIGRVTADVTSFTDTGILPSSSYEYKVAAHNQTGDGDSSPPLAVTTPSAGPAPDMPATLTQDNANTTDSQIALNWSAVTTPSTVTVQGYHLYRRVAGAGQTWIRLSSTPITATSYIDRNLDRALAYDYKVTAVSSVNSQSSAKELDNIATLVPAQIRPTATITAPASFRGINVDFARGTDSDDRIQKLTQIKAIIDDPNVGGTGTDQVSWSLVLRPTGVGSNTKVGDVLLASGTGLKGVARNDDGTLITPGGEILCTLDPTLYPSGNYDLILTASDSTGPGAPAVTKISLYSQTKLGNLTLPVTDLAVNVPGGQPIIVRRVYDSGRANELGDFGYGWKLQLSGTDLRTTARAGTGTRGGGTTLRQGDVVYVTLPNGEEHAFQFWPIPTNYSIAQGAGVNPYGIGYVAATYWIQFACVDGSNAKLTVPGDINEPVADDRIYLTYDREHAEFWAPATSTGLPSSYNPTRRDFGNEYQVATVDGSTYNINATTGSLRWSKDANDNQTDYNANGPTENGIHLNIERNGPAGTISKIAVVDGTGAEIGNPVLYTYDTSYSGGRPVANLLTMQDRAQQTITYDYDSAPGRAHFLTKVTDNRGVAVLNASYDDAGLLESLTDANGNPANVGVGNSDGSEGGEIVEDLTPQHNTTEIIYDDHGNPTRVIKSIKNNVGVVTGYSVSVSTYSYYNAGISSEIFDLFDLASPFEKKAGTTNQNSLISATQYATFVVNGIDAAGLRYSRASTQLLSETTFDGLSYSGPGRNLPATQTQFLDGNVKRIATFANYDAFGHPGRVTVALQQPDPANSSNTITTTVSSTRNAYDDRGNLRYSFDALGQGTEYVYTDGTNGVPRGLLLKTYRVNGESTLDDTNPNTNPTRIDGDNSPLSESAYYTQTDIDNAVAGAYTGSLKYSIDAAGQKSYFTYDRAGNLIHSYRLWLNPDSGQPNRWVGTTSVYDGAGRLTDSYDAAYLDDGDGVLGTTAVPTDPSIDETVYRTPLRTGSTQFNAGGQTATTTDQYGGQTVNTYDANGRVIQTTYPDGTVTQSVYDVMGRVILSLDRFKPGQSDPIQATRNVYDALGRVVETQRVSGISVTITAVSGVSDVSRVTAVSNAGIIPMDSGQPERGWQIDPTFAGYLSRARNFYDEQGRVIEQIDAAGLRTGTIYNGDGRVLYTGILKDEDLPNNIAPAGGHSTLSNGIEMRAFVLSDLATYTTYTYDQLDVNGKLYDRVTDALGHHTDSYKDLLGRGIKTVYDDGTSSQMLYGDSDQPVTGHVVSGQTIVGRQETKIDQAGVATDYFYDRSVQLTDVWQPAVDDATTVPTDLVRPHGHYTYDPNGNQLTQVDPRGKVTSFAYDEQGRRLSRTLPSDGNGATSDTETWTYDGRGRAATHVDFKGQSTRYVYDDDDGSANDDLTAIGSGRMWKEERFDGAADATPDESTVHGFDALGRSTSVTEFDQLDGDPELEEVRLETSGFDPITGAEIVTTTPEGVVRHAYDPATGRLLATWTGSATDVTSARSSAYTLTEYEYNYLGQLWHVMANRLGGATPGTAQVTTYVYDAVGNLDTTTLPNGVVEDYNYDGLNRLTGLVVTDDNAVELFTQAYTLLSNGQRDYVIETRDDGASTVKIDWGYDALNRLTGETRDEGNDSVQNGGDYADTFAFDFAGNRVSKTHDAVGTTNDETITSTYNDRDQLTAEDSTITANDQATTYDANGNTISVTTYAGAKKYVWDLRNRMVGYDANGDGDTADTGDSSYAYDQDGNRVSKDVVGTGSTYFLNDTQNLTGYSKAIEEKSAPTGTPTRSYVFGPDIIAQSDATNGTAYFLKDGHGTTRALTDTSGSVIAGQSYDFDAFLNPLSFTASSALTQWLAPDGRTDVETGLRLNGVRYVTAGRFWSEDPRWEFVGDPQSPATMHKYLYVSGNPVNLVDPSGHISTGELVVAIGIGLNVANLLFHLGSGISHFAHGEIDAGNQDFAWAAIDLLTLGLPFAGPGLQVANVGVTVVSLSRAGVNAAAIWGYLTTLFSVSNAAGGGGGSSSSGGGSGGGGSQGQYVNEDQSNWSDRARAYQQQITSRSGQAYNLKGVKFDGFDGTNLLDAKGPGYSNFLDKSGQWQKWFEPEQFRIIAERQFKAAGGRPIVWHFAEKEVADAVRPLVQRQNIQVVHTPAAP